MGWRFAEKHSEKTKTPVKKQNWKRYTAANLRHLFTSRNIPRRNMGHLSCVAVGVFCLCAALISEAHASPVSALRGINGPHRKLLTEDTALDQTNPNGTRIEVPSTGGSPNSQTWLYWIAGLATVLTVSAALVAAVKGRLFHR